MKQDQIVFEEMIRSLKKSGTDIINDLTPVKADAWHMASCICREAGELFDATKKFAIYGKVPDMDNITEESGDIEFYLEGLRQIFAIRRKDTLTANIKKLSKRYSDLQYSNKSAIDRVDKKES